MMRFQIIVMLAFLAAYQPAGGQEHVSFNVVLALNTESAEKTIGLYEGLTGRPDDIAALRGSQIALATTSLLAQRPLQLADLVGALESAKYNQDLGDDVFRMKGARQNVTAMKDLLEELRRRNFGQRVVSTVAQLFPSDVALSSRIPLYVVAFGHQNIDAFVRRVVWRGDVPQFVGEGQGELTIVVNLLRAVEYGRSTDERFIGLLTVVAHEVFHAAFGAYKDSSPQWQAWYAGHRRSFDAFIDLTQNEGIAYYLTLVQQSRGTLPRDWEEKIQSAFSTFNSSAEELLSPRTTGARASDIIRLSNSSGYWQNYGAITGMIVARQIDRVLGRAALTRTLVQGPYEFFGIYLDLMRQDNSVPPLSPSVANEISRLRP